MSELPFNIQVYLILSSAFGQLDRLLEDTVYAIRDIGYDTKDLNYYRYEDVT